MKSLILFMAISLVLVGCSAKTEQVKIDNVEPNASSTETIKIINESKKMKEDNVMDGKVVKIGDTVSVDYIGTLDNGTVFDQSKKPFKFTVGADQVIKGFNDGVIGMKIGEEKTVHIPVEDAYGYSSNENIITVPIEKIDGGNVTIGQTIYANDGQTEGIVTKIENGTATVDFNHPLAGKALNFKIILRAIG